MNNPFNLLHRLSPQARHRVGLFLAVLLFLLLAGYQLGLPGLHYDEAKEAGVNALELLTGAPVTAFRDAVIPLGDLRLPLMVQDYIGALNVYLAIPILALTGIGVPNLRLLPLILAVLTLFLLERTVAEWEMGRRGDRETRRQGDRETRRQGDKETGRQRTPIPDPRSLIPDPQSPIPNPRSPLLAVLLLVASPSFVFWSRQGIFVTNLTQPLTLLCVWMGLRWLRTGRSGALILSALAGGLALYAKLLAVWVVGPFGVMAAGWWLWQRFWVERGPDQAKWRVPRPPMGAWAGTVAAFGLGLLPLILFNVQTGGTFASIGGNLGQSYYGVDNANILANLPVRLAQVISALTGDHFWYLGGLYANRLAPWLAGAAVILGLVRRPRIVLPPLILLILALFASLFTVSDLFITHYALLQPFMVALVALGIGDWGDRETRRQGDKEMGRMPAVRLPFPQLLASAFVLFWLFFDLSATVNYHWALTRSGGLGDHSDATYHLAYHLRYNGLGAPIALDWGMEAPVQFLSEGTVRPIEIFGYDSLTEPDPDFVQRLDLFLPNPANVYLLRAPDATVFGGRREIFLAQAAALGLTPHPEATFAQRDGQALFEVWRVEP